MKKVDVSLPELALVAGTRAMLGAGVGLLLSEKLQRRERRTLGWALFAIGAVSTLPIALEIFNRRGSSG
jgi:hypothetical protein